MKIHSFSTTGILLFLFFIGSFCNVLCQNSGSNSKINDLKNYIKWSTKHANLKSFDSANKYLERSELLALEIDDNNWKAMVNYNSGKIKYWQGWTEEGKRMLDNSINELVLNDTMLIKTHCLYSEILDSEDNSSESLKHLIAAEKVIRTHKVFSYMDSLALGHIYAEIGNINVKGDNSKVAEKYYTNALKYAENEEWLRSSILFDIANLYEEEGYNEEALQFSLKSLRSVQLQKRKILIPTAYAMVARNYLQLKKPDSAIYYAEKGLINNIDCRIDWLNNIWGKGLLQNQMPREAMKHFEVADDFSTSEEVILEVLENKRNAYTQMGDYKEALQSNEEYLKLKQELDDRRVKQEIAEITQSYESEKKTLEITMLKTENEYDKLLIKKQRSRLVFLALLFFLTLGLLGLIFYFYKKQKKQRQILYEKNLRLAQQLQISNGVNHKGNVSKTDFNTSKLGVIKESVLELVEKEFFLQKDMTLQKMAKAIDSNTTYLSKVINEHYKTSFANFINDLRISHTLKSLETQPELKNYTIDYIAGNSGFTSSSTFYKAFKKSTGLTPSYYIKKRLGEY